MMNKIISTVSNGFSKKAKSKSKEEDFQGWLSKINDAKSFLKNYHDKCEALYQVYNGGTHEVYHPLLSKNYNQQRRKRVLSFGEILSNIGLNKGNEEYFKQPQINFLKQYTQIQAPYIYENGGVPSIEIDVYGKSSKLKTELAEYTREVFNVMIEKDSFSTQLASARMDYLISGMGVVKVDFVTNHYSDEYTELKIKEAELMGIFEDMSVDPKIEEKQKQKMAEEISAKEQYVAIRHVAFNDFIYSPVTNWEDVTWIGIRYYATEMELGERFPDVKKENFDMMSKFDANSWNNAGQKTSERYVYWEIWDKEIKKRIIVAKDKIIEEMDDPYKLKDFFPIPKPAFMSINGMSLIPTPDYENYYKSANIINNLYYIKENNLSILDNPHILFSSEKMAQELKTILQENGADKIVVMPSDIRNSNLQASNPTQEMQLSMKPFKDDAIATINAIDDMIQRASRQMDEQTGVPDLVRGGSKANETATAQTLKDSYLMTKLSTKKQPFEDMIAGVIQIVVDGVFGVFTDKEILKRLDLSTRGEDGENADPQAQAMQTQQMIEKYQEYNALLKDDDRRCYLIKIESDSVSASKSLMQKQTAREVMEVLMPSLQLSQSVMQGLISPELAEGICKLATSGQKNMPAELVDSIDKMAEYWIESLQTQANLAQQQQMQEQAQQQQILQSQQQQALEQEPNPQDGYY
jgi:hypothetical protein